MHALQVGERSYIRKEIVLSLIANANVATVRDMDSLLDKARTIEQYVLGDDTQPKTARKKRAARGGQPST